MYSIAICIPTYKRPTMLRKLISSIIENDVNLSLINDVRIIIVDNDEERSGEIVLEKVDDKYYNNLDIHYYNYPVKGLSNVRNEIFKRALEFHPDYIVCIDDDEYSTPDWLNQLVGTITSNKCDIAIGPVIPNLESSVSPSIAYFFKYHIIKNDTQIFFFESGNFIISAAFITAHNLNFDNRFNSTGAEDSYFGVSALKKGASIYWSANAITYETIPLKRSTLNWLIKRSYRSAITYTYVLILEKKYIKLLKKMAVSVIYLFLGLISLLLLPFQSKFKFWGIVKVATAIGGFAGLLNIKYHEYQK